MKQITSVQNPFIKSLVQLQEKAKVRKQTGTFLIEGQREIELALKGGYELETILICTDLAQQSENPKIRKSEHQIIEISKEVYQKLAYRDTTEGILAIAKTKSLALSDLKLIQKSIDFSR
jgi:RNA methyltransferase, TrmH family